MNVLSDARERLLKEDANFRRLADKHQEYEDRLTTLRDKRFLSDEEKAEEVQLKKRKLAIKDEMEQIVRRARD